MHSQYFILGVDAGVHASAVALSFDKKIVGTCLTKQGFEDLVQQIEAIGVPSIVACDVSKPPSLVRRVAAAFHATLFFPPRDMSERDKEHLSPLKNRHLRDAHAAAIVCHRKFANRIRQLLKQENSDYLIHCLLRGVAVHDARIKTND